MTEPNVDYFQASPNTVALNGTTTITRSVPRRCEVCKGKAKRMPTCQVCEGKGWLYVWETETTYSAPYIEPSVSPYTPYPPSYPQWNPPMYTSEPNTYKGAPFSGIAINCMARTHA
jgi:hypothetical protein